MNLNDKKIAIIGLGYVGLPLAIEFAKKYKVLGFDIDHTRILELSKGEDRTKEADIESILQAMDLKKTTNNGLIFSSDTQDLTNYNIYIVTVPTPIDQFKAPDLKPLLKASEMLGKVLKAGDIVVYESTVYPGCTEEDCVPVLEKFSGLKYNQDFYCGYSPERINPGDKVNTLTKIKKVTSGSNPDIAEVVDTLYSSIIEAGTHKAPNIKVAEASKAIENAQRDVNISFVNELALIFDRMGIDTNDVLDAAGTKWNFLKFKPGLVGGHCISVDPYYLAHKAERLGYYPQVILSGRRVNDNMSTFVANKVIKLLISKNHVILTSRVLVLGITFKENCPDIRNTRVVDIRKELLEFGCQVDILDTWANPSEVKLEFGFDILTDINIPLNAYNCIIVCVAHEDFKQLNLRNCVGSNGVVFDIKGVLDRSTVDGRL
jgi:UDP-N-acetyl-D-galactosamine dehydrogenase